MKALQRCAFKGSAPPELEEQEKQRLAAKDIASRIQKAVNEIKRLQKRYRDRGDEKSLIQLLVKIRELGKDAAIVALARIKNNQWGHLSEADKIFVSQQQMLVLQNVSPAEKLLSEALRLK